MPTNKDLLSRIEALEASVQALEAREAAREEAARRRIAAVAAMRSSAEAAADTRTVEEQAKEREAIRARRAARFAPKPATELQTVTLGGLAATALLIDGVAREVDGVTVTVAAKTATLEGTVSSLTRLARTLYDDAAEPGRRAARAIYSGLRLPLPSWLQPARR